jgi:hypothetical protein
VLEERVGVLQPKADKWDKIETERLRREAEAEAEAARVAEEKRREALAGHHTGRYVSFCLLLQLFASLLSHSCACSDTSLLDFDGRLTGGKC